MGGNLEEQCGPLCCDAIDGFLKLVAKAFCPVDAELRSTQVYKGFAQRSEDQLYGYVGMRFSVGQDNVKK